MRGRVLPAVLGPPRLRPLSIAHGLAAAGDACVTVSLAGSLFFNISPDASRQQVLLYLLVTMTPLAVLAPLVGPTVDRFRRRPQLVASVCYVLRGIFCLMLAASLFELSFYLWAVGLLIISKASGVVKQALVPLLTDQPDQLVAASARLARMSTICGAIGGGAGAALLNVADATWVLRLGTAFFAAAAVVIMGLRPEARDEPVSASIEYAEMHLPTVVVGSVGFMAIRGAVGFFVFTMAFTLRRASEPAWVYGAAIGLYGAGAFLGNVITPAMRRRFREQTLLIFAIAAPASVALVGVLGVSRPLLLAVAALIGLSTTLGRHAFDSLLQARAPASIRGRAGARFETRFSLAFVGGALVATPIRLPAQASMAVLSVIYIPALVVFIRAFANARRLEQDSAQGLELPLARLANAGELLRDGQHRAAVLEASAATDMAQLVRPGIAGADERAELDLLRREALDPGLELDAARAEHAIDLARELVSRAPAASTK